MIFRDELGNVLQEGEVVGLIVPMTMCKIEKLAPPVLDAQGNGVAHVLLSAVIVRPVNENGIVPGVIAVKYPQPDKNLA